MRPALLLLLFACRSKELEEAVVAPPPTPVPAPVAPVVPVAKAPACDRIIREAAQRIVAESQRLALATQIDRKATVMITSCEAETWPAMVMTCIAGARLDVDLDACTEELTYRQHQQLHAKIAQLVPVSPSPPRPPPRRPSPPDDPLSNPFADLDCTRAIREPRNAACVRQYCTKHPTDARCAIE